MKNERILLILPFLVGALFSTLPHIMQWLATGSYVWFVDYDELELYLPSAAQAYFNGWWNAGDPLFKEYKATVYPWMQMMPGVLLAKTFGLDVAGISVVWRFLAGALTALGWIVFFRFGLRMRIGITVLLSCLLLTDAGVLAAKPFLNQWRMFWMYLSGSMGPLLESSTLLHQEWRIISPGLSFYAMLIYLACLYRSLVGASSFNFNSIMRDRHTYFSIFSLGYLFYIYFYYWTTAGLGLALSLLFLPRHRLRIFIIGCGGLLVGLPAVVSSYLFKKNAPADWLPRSDKFLPIGHLDELLIPYGSLFLIVITAFFVYRRYREYTVLLCHIVAGVCLLNHQLITGLQIENFHFNYAWTMVLAALVLVLLYRETQARVRSRLILTILGIFLCLHFAVGTFLRIYEYKRTADVRKILPNLAYFKEFSVALAKLPQNIFVGGDNQVIRFMGVFHNQRPLYSYFVKLSPHMDNDEIDARVALNAYLEGLSSAEFTMRERRRYEHDKWDVYARDTSLREQRILQRVALFQDVARNTQAYLDRFAIEAIVARRAQRNFTDFGFEQIGNNEYHEVWLRKPSPF